ncbi:hypothetical protein [Spiroplasma endosymbiont of Labia minor]|uniref:hypothetical protein n=1 Tax=Spiroplasma endosymbiont of Labia minor TaxID=3066305 RepID=UPI0030D3874C
MLNLEITFEAFNLNFKEDQKVWELIYMNSYYLGIDIFGNRTTSIFDGFNIHTFLVKSEKNILNLSKKLGIYTHQ